MSPLSNQELQTLDKIQNYILKLNKQIIKYGKDGPIHEIINNLDTTLQEICSMLISRSESEIAQTTQKLFGAWREIYTAQNKPDQILTEVNLHDDPIKIAKQQLLHIQGQTGKLGGVKINKQVFRESQTSRHHNQTLPTITFPNTKDSLTDRQLLQDKRNSGGYELEQDQRDLLQEVLKQSHNLNVQIVMKRYDPKIKLFQSKGTDTNDDAFNTMRSYTNQQYDQQIMELMSDNDAHIEELRKALQAKPDLDILTNSDAQDNLKILQKQLYLRTQEFELAIGEIQKDAPQEIKVKVIDFIEYVKTSYKDVQDSSLKSLLNIFNDCLKRQMAEWIKQQTLNLQNPSKKQKGNLQKLYDEEKDKHKTTISTKNQEIDKLRQLITDLNNKLKNIEQQQMSTLIEIEQYKVKIKQLEEDKTVVQYEKRKLEKRQMSTLQKGQHDETTQVTDTQTQQYIAKLQKEIQELSQKLYAQQSELNKMAKSSQDQKSMAAEMGSGDIDYNGSESPRNTNTNNYRSAYEIDYVGTQNDIDDQFSAVNRSSTIQNIQSVVNLKIKSKQSQRMIKERSLSKSPTLQVHHSNKSSIQENYRQKQSPRSQSGNSQRILPKNPFMREQSIAELEEENLLNSTHIVNKNSETGSKVSKFTTKQMGSAQQGKNGQNNIPMMVDSGSREYDVEMTQAGTTFRTSSGKIIKTERTKSGKHSIQEQAPINRRIQTEVIDGSSEQINYTYIDKKTEIQLVRSPTTRDLVKKGKKQSFRPLNRGNSEALVDAEDIQPQSQRSIKSGFAPKLVASKKVIFNEISEEQQKQKTNSLSQQFAQPRLSRQFTSPQVSEHTEQQLQRSQTSGSQRIQMAIQLNNEERIQYETEWHPRQQHQGVQTELQPLIELLKDILVDLQIPQESLQQIVDKLNSQFSLDPINKLENSTSIQLKPQIKKVNPELQSSLHLQQSQQSQQQVEQQQQQQIKRSSTQLTKQQQIIEEQQDIIEQENILKLSDGTDDQQQQLEQSYEQILQQIVENENNGLPLEQIKVNDLKTEQTIQKLYKNLNHKKTVGVNAINQMIRKYYKKSEQELISYAEFKGFFQKISILHKQCGIQMTCTHLQRFFMRLGYTCANFSRRQIIKTKQQIVKPFQGNQNTRRSSENTVRSPQNRYISQQYYPNKNSL